LFGDESFVAPNLIRWVARVLKTQPQPYGFLLDGIAFAILKGGYCFLKGNWLMQKQISIHLNVSGDVEALREVLTVLHEQTEPQQWLSLVESGVPSQGNADDATSTAESFEKTGIAVAVHEPPNPSERVYLSESHPQRFAESSETASAEFRPL
jgi:hypothetical protein